MRLERGGSARHQESAFHRSEKSAGVKPRRQAVFAHEDARHVALVGKAAGKGRFRKRRALSDQPPGEMDASLDKLGMRRQSGRPGEAAQQLEAAEAAFPGKIGKRDGGQRIVVDQIPRRADG